MPLLRVTHIDEHVILGIWEMTEHPSAFPEWYEEARKRFHAEGRQLKRESQNAYRISIHDDDPSECGRLCGR